MHNVVLRIRSRVCTVTVFLVAVAWIAGLDSQVAFAKCGRAISGSAWKYASTAELIQWDGRWWNEESTGNEMLIESHMDPGAKPCTHCGGRPIDERPEPSPGPVVRIDGQSGVCALQASLIHQETPPPGALDVANDLLSGRTLEVAKRPPKGLR